MRKQSGSRGVSLSEQVEMASERVFVSLLLLQPVSLKGRIPSQVKADTVLIWPHLLTLSGY